MLGLRGTDDEWRVMEDYDVRILEILLDWRVLIAAVTWRWDFNLRLVESFADLLSTQNNSEV